jgi:hypothetical protein
VSDWEVWNDDDDDVDESRDEDDESLDGDEV